MRDSKLFARAATVNTTLNRIFVTMLSVNNIYFIFVNWLDTVNNVEWKDKYNGASRRLYNFDVMKY